MIGQKVLGFVPKGVCPNRGLTLSGEAKNRWEFDSPPKGQTPLGTKPRHETGCECPPV